MPCTSSEELSANKICEIRVNANLSFIEPFWNKLPETHFLTAPNRTIQRYRRRAGAKLLRFPKCWIVVSGRDARNRRDRR